MSGPDGSADGNAGGNPDRVRQEFGYVWGKTDGTIWLRNDDGDYKRIEPSFVEPLEALARGERDPSEADPAVLDAVDLLADEGYLEPGGEMRRVETPEDIRLWPRVAVSAGLTLALSVLVVTQWEAIWSPPGSIGTTLVVPVFFIAATLLHELGHYAASKPYFEPSISLGRLNGVIPAVITETRDAWQCPRNVRLWISLAGPFVDVVITLGLAIALSLTAGHGILGTLVLIQIFRLLFVLNPLIDGDGYWLLVDIFGTHNLRTHAFRDLKQGRPTPKAAFAVSVVLFTGWFVAASGYFLVQTLQAL